MSSGPSVSPEVATPVTDPADRPDAGDGTVHGSADQPTVGTARRFLTLSLRPVLLYLASRAGMLLVASATSSDTHQPLSKSLTAWDSFWYLSIASGGYVRHIPPGHGNPAQSNLGFFPLIPLLTWMTHEVTRFGFSVSGLLTTFTLGREASPATRRRMLCRSPANSEPGDVNRPRTSA